MHCGELLRRRDQQASEVSDQQLHASSTYDRPDLPVPLAGGALFRWVKMHLRIKAFFGTSENAVKTQIWIAVPVYVLVAILRKRLNLEASLYQLLQVLSVTLFEKTPILRALQIDLSQNDLDDSGNQLILFEF